MKGRNYTQIGGPSILRVLRQPSYLPVQSSLWTLIEPQRTLRLCGERLSTHDLIPRLHFPILSDIINFAVQIRAENRLLTLEAGVWPAAKI